MKNIVQEMTEQIIKEIAGNRNYWEEWYRLETISPLGGARQYLEIIENKITVKLEYDPYKYLLLSDD